MPPKPAKGKSTKPRRPALTKLSDAIEIDFVILADYAQSAQGKLNLIGGGWNLHNATQYPSTLPFALGIGILVPWSQTNRKHNLSFVIKQSEGSELARGGGEFEMGREPGLPPGMTQRAIVGMTGQLQLPDSGTYEVIVTAASATKRVIFEALPVPQTR